MDGLAEYPEKLDLVRAGEEIYDLIRELYPIHRSITGEGVRATLRRLSTDLPLEIHEVPSGTRVLDWTVPKEWNIRSAYVKDPNGATVVDLNDSNLHVLGYSTPVRATLSLDELRPHLYSDPENPEWTPYLTSFYSANWGFCLPDRRLRELVDGEYEVVIDSTLEDGALTYGELKLRGALESEVLISTHVCHPSLCNDNLSGIAVCAMLARVLSGIELRHTYRFLFIPGTIGAITWLARNEETISRVRHGLVATGLGDGGMFTYKRSRIGNAEIDHVAEYALQSSGKEHRVIDFAPYGYDERQFCSPGFNLPVGSLTRTPYAEYPEYHTSGDDLDFVQADKLGESLDVYLRVLSILDTNQKWLNLNPKGEPQLGRRGLFRALGHGSPDRSQEMVLLWILNMSDGTNSLLDIARHSGLEFATIRGAARALAQAGLLEVSA